jgi:outer membrane protein assembly factor BamA
MVVLGGFSALLFSQAIRAQSQQEKPQRCPPPAVSVDELKEMTGKKVYPKIIIDDVKFDGPARLPDSGKEQSIITELKHREFDAGLDWLNEILEVPIGDAWRDQGFFKVIATGAARVVSKDLEYEHVVITIHVNEGLRYRLGDVRFRSSDPDDRETLAFPREELRELLPLREGDIFDVAKIRESLNAMKKLYDYHGYINFVATPETEADDATQRISLRMELDEGKQFRVGKVEVFGLEPSKAAALTSRVKPGDVFNRSVVDKFIEANIAALPEGASCHVLGLDKDFKKRTVDVVVDFRPWPEQMEF